MALNHNERELLAIIKHYNSQRRNVGKLVTKLYDGFDLIATSNLTGFTHDEIVAILEASRPKPRKANPEKAAVNDSNADVSPFEKLADQITNYFNEKNLKPGSITPPQSTIAKDLKANMRYVSGACKLLEERGVIEKTRHNGRIRFRMK
jgi:hypothetical protein